MGRLIKKGLNYNIVKYGNFTVEQSNGVRITTFKNYDDALKLFYRLENI